MGSIGATMPTFTEGQIVYLKSGSRPMTVEMIDPGGTIKVVWFSRVDDQLKRETLHFNALEAAEDPKAIEPPDGPVTMPPANDEPKLSTPTVWVDSDGQPIHEEPTT
jgi:uncharacterized protein YodC (DUF2158 family)